MAQQFQCSKTSRPQVARGFKRIDWVAGQINLDYGGGKYDMATEFLKTLDVMNLVYDPYNRSEEDNHFALTMGYHHSTTTTCFNVLNVIKEKKWRRAAIFGCRFPNTEKIYFQVYEGDRSGEGRQTGEGNWQNNKRLSFYRSEIRGAFPQSTITMKDGLITVDFTGW